MKKFKYFLCLVLICLSFVGGGSSAASALSDVKNFDNSPVLTDLEGSTINGEKFNIANYPYKENGTPSIIAFSEYCYSFKQELAEKYGLYVYLYNPSGREIKAEKNTIQLATEYNGESPVRYDKYNVTICNYSIGTYDRLFYKFKVDNVSDIYSRVNENNTARRYDISGIELNFGVVEDVSVGNTWIFSGFAKGCGPSEEADSTLSCSTNKFETVHLEVTDTYYRYNNGVNTQSQISSVYFGVENALLENYGTLQKIHAEWLKAQTSPVIVSKEKWLYDVFYPFIGKEIGKRDNDLNYYLYQGDGLGGNIWGYNVTATIQLTKMAYLFDVSAVEDWSVSSQNMQEYMIWYSNKFGNKTVAGKYNPDLFSSVDNQKTDITIDANSTFDINGFTTGTAFGDWFNKLFNSALQDKPIENIQPIYIIQDSDFVGSDKEISDRLFVASSDISKLRSDYEANKAVGKKTVLFRFAVSEYSSYDITAQEYAAFATPHLNKVYMADETVYLDFDIIDLTFQKDNVSTVIPAVNNPIDVIGDITAPPETLFDGFEDFLNVLKMIGIVVLGLIALLIVGNIIKAFVRLFKK